MTQIASPLHTPAEPSARRCRPDGSVILEVRRSWRGREVWAGLFIYHQDERAEALAVSP